jgi:Holliday junction DNA helicase RuvB
MKRSITTEFTEEDEKIERTLRPQYLKDYVGQKKIKENMKIYIEAAKKRNEPLDHILLYGPPGLGKTTLAGIVANEMGVHIKVTAGPAIEKPGDMAAILNNLGENDVLFIDEIHRLNRQVEEILYPAMEDFVIDIVIGKGASSRSIRLDLPKFTLIGATTRAGMLSAPLRDRFGVVSRLEFYTVDELSQIIKASAKVLDVEIDDQGARELAMRSRGTPRLANRLLKRVRDFAEIKYDGTITLEVARYALDLLEVDCLGLDNIDRKILKTLIYTFSGRPVGVNAIAEAIGEDPGTIEDVYEPYLVQSGLVIRTQNGRVASDLAYKHFGIDRPEGPGSIFGGDS